MFLGLLKHFEAALDAVGALAADSYSESSCESHHITYCYFFTATERSRLLGSMRCVSRALHYNIYRRFALGLPLLERTLGFRFSSTSVGDILAAGDVLSSRVAAWKLRNVSPRKSIFPSP